MLFVFVYTAELNVSNNSSHLTIQMLLYVCIVYAHAHYNTTCWSLFHYSIYGIVWLSVSMRACVCGACHFHSFHVWLLSILYYFIFLDLLMMRWKAENGDPEMRKEKLFVSINLHSHTTTWQHEWTNNCTVYR